MVGLLENCAECFPKYFSSVELDRWNTAKKTFDKACGDRNRKLKLRNWRNLKAYCQGRLPEFKAWRMFVIFCLDCFRKFIWMPMAVKQGGRCVLANVHYGKEALIHFGDNILLE